MRFLRTKKGVALIAVLTVAIAAAVGAYAYFATTGSGSGTATSGSAPTAQITLHASFSSGIVPGGSESVSFTADNANTTSSERVNTISFGSVTSTGACQTFLTANPGEFSMAPVTSNTTVAASASGAALSGIGTLQWADSATVDQTPCAGSPLTLNVSSN